MSFKHPWRMIALLSLTALLSCSREFKSTEYWPMNGGAWWEYNSPLHRMEVTDVTETPECRVLTLTCLDSSQMVLWRESIETRPQGLFWQGLTTPGGYWPEIRFDPPLPLTPQSDQPEAIYTFYGLERRGDDSIYVHVTFQIDGYETVETQAGSFSDCLKMSMKYDYSGTFLPPLLAGRSVFWFARGVGLVRFQMPSGQGRLTRYSLGAKP